jgi:hypothetical protein
MSKSSRLIDCHVHLNNYHQTSGRPTEENVRELLFWIRFEPPGGG